MNFTEETLTKIEALAAVFYTEREVAEFIGVSSNAFIEAVSCKDSDVHKRYYSGWRQAEFDLRQIIMRLAISGSTPAQNLVLQLHKKAVANRR